MYEHWTRLNLECIQTYKLFFHSLLDVETEHHTFNTSNTGKSIPQTESTFSSVASISDGNGTLETLTNSSRFTETISLSTFDLGSVSSSDLTSVTMEIGRNPSSSKEAHFTKTSEEPLHRYFPKTLNYSPSTIDLLSEFFPKPKKLLPSFIQYQSICLTNFLT